MIARPFVASIGLALVACASSETPRLASPEPASGLSVTALPRAPLPVPAPSVRIVRPRNGQILPRGAVIVALEVENWPMEPGGNHVHVKVDNREEVAVHDVSEPFSLSDVYETRTTGPLAEGTHLLRVFLARSNHESVKTPDTFSSVRFHVGRPSQVPDFDENAPLLTYSRPQGCASDASRLLDFVLSNVGELSSSGYRVNFVLNGEHHGTLTQWAPHRIDGLGRGLHTIRLTLVDPEGKPVPGPYNDTTRSFRTHADCLKLGLVADDDGGG